MVKILAKKKEEKRIEVCLYYFWEKSSVNN